MNEITVDKALDLIDSLVYGKTGKHLTELAKLIFRGVWEGKNYKEIVAKNNRWSAGHARKAGSDLWQLLSAILEEPVNFYNLKAAVERYSHLQPPAIESATVEPAIAVNNRGFELYINGHLSQAKKEFDLAIKIQPDHAASYYNLAWSYERFGDFNHAIKLYRKAASHGLAAAYCNLVRLHIVEDKKYDLAVDICGQGLKLVKEDTVETDKIVKAALLTYLSWAWIELGLYEEALEKLQEALELDSDRASTHALMAQALENLGHRTEAEEAWKNYVNNYPKCDSRDKGVWMGMARKRLKELSCTSPTNGNLD